METAHLVELSASFFLSAATIALTWVSWKLYKIDAQKTTVVAKESIDSMRDVALTALTHEDRVRQLKHISKRPTV